MSKEKPKDVREDMGVPHYCEEFDKELNYKLWSTAGARYNASKRLEKKARWSCWAINFCSGYVILFSIFSVLFSKYMFVHNTEIVNLIIIFFSITLSLFIIIFSLAESNSRYDLRASRHHSCALEVASLYKRLRYLKSCYKNKTKDDSFLDKAYQISLEYDKILAQHENHEEIDFFKFKLQKPDYVSHKMSWCEKKSIRWITYPKEFIVYWLVIVVPLVLFSIMCYVLS
jgi:hypothetical protein